MTASSRAGSEPRRPDVRGHAHRDEEQAEQQALEGLEVGLQLVAELAVGEQHAGEEGAERHREAGQVREQRGADDRQERGRGEHLAHLHARHQPQRRAQHQPPAADDDDGDDRDELRERQPQGTVRRPVRAAATSSGSSASTGSTARSWNSRMPKAARPCCVFSCRRSASTCSTSGVEDSDRPKPTIAAASGGWPSTQARAAEQQRCRRAPARRRARTPGAA